MTVLHFDWEGVADARCLFDDDSQPRSGGERMGVVTAESDRHASTAYTGDSTQFATTFVNCDGLFRDLKAFELAAVRNHRDGNCRTLNFYAQNARL